MFLKSSKNRTFLGICAGLSLFFLTSFQAMPEEQDRQAVLPPEIQAVTLVWEKTDVQIILYFLKQMIRSSFGETSTDILSNSKALEIFVKNFKYDSDKLVKVIPLKETVNIYKIVKATLNAFIPKTALSLLTGSGDFFLYTETIRGPAILCLTGKPLEYTLQKDVYLNWHLSILSPEGFVKNCLFNGEYMSALQTKKGLMELLLRNKNILENKYFSASHNKRSLFLETRPSSGYDVSSITREIRFFPNQSSNLYELNFINLPVIQYFRDDKGYKDFFVMLKDPKLLAEVMKFLEPETKRDPQLNVFFERLQLYQEESVKQNFPNKGFESRVQDFFNSLDYSLNYDAIVTDKKQEVYDNIRCYLLSNGVKSFEELKNNKRMIDDIIEKFFVLGTTYFFRSWSTIGVFPEYLSAAVNMAVQEKRPLKIKIFACSTGEEALTFAFTLLDKGIDHFKILASDINPQFIETAKKMIYSRESFERLPQFLRNHLLNDYFIRTEEGYEIKNKKFFSDHIEYRTLDITKDLPENLSPDLLPPYDLVSCQNIFLYLNPLTISDLYEKILNKISPHGLFILADKYYDHYSLYKKTSRRNILHYNRHIVKVMPPETSPEDLAAESRKVNADNFSFESVRQYYKIGKMSPEEKNKWLEELIKKYPGNHEVFYSLAADNLIEMGNYEKAEALIKEGILRFPYLLDNYVLACEVFKRQKNPEMYNYALSIRNGMDLLYKTPSQEALHETLGLYQRALKINPKAPLGYYSLGYQLFRYGQNMKKNNAPLVDYEVFFNQAFRNFNFSKSLLPDNVYVYRGIAEVAYSLYAPYVNNQNFEIANRLIFNALVKIEPNVKDCKDFTVLHILGQLQSIIGRVYLENNNMDLAYDYLDRALNSFKQASLYTRNYNPVLLYRFYVDNTQAWFFMHNLLKRRHGIKTYDYSLNQCQNKILENINNALGMNSVYGIEAVELRDQFFEMNAVLKEEYEKSFQ